MIRGIQFAYYILSGVFGFIAGMHFVNNFLCIFAIILFGSIIGAYFFSKNKILLLLFITVLFFLFGNFCCNSLNNNDIPRFKIRKNMELILSINSITEKKDDKVVYGYADIISGSKKLSAIIGEKSYFILNNDLHDLFVG